MKTVCLLFEIHQPFRLKKYRFYDIGADHYYYDDYANDEILKRLAYQSYIPAAKMLLEMIEASEKKFKVALSISGVAMEQFEMYCPEFLDCVRELVSTGCCELCCETYSHSLSSLVDPEDFKYQVDLQKKIIFDTFQYDSKTFVNTGFIYNDEIGAEVAAMGFKGIVTEGTRHVLGWKSPNYVYSTAAKQDVGLMFRNTKLSEDICLNFQYGLDAGQYMSWIAESPAEEKVYLIAMNFDVVGRTFHPSPLPTLVTQFHGTATTRTSAPGWATTCRTRPFVPSTPFPSVCTCPTTRCSVRTSPTCSLPTTSSSCQPRWVPTFHSLHMTRASMRSPTI